MARERRSVARSAFTSDKLSLCSDAEFLLFVGIIVNADDDGRESGKPESIKTKLASRNWSPARIAAIMGKLHTLELIYWYSCECGSFYEIINWEYYQRGAWQGVSRVKSTITSYSAVHCKQCGAPLKSVTDFTVFRANRSELNRSEVKEMEVKETGAHKCEGETEPETDAGALFTAEASRRRLADKVGKSIPQEITNAAVDETVTERRAR